MTAKPWTDAELESDAVSKKDLVTFLQDSATYEFLKDRKLYGKPAAITKSSKKPDLITAYTALFAQDAFRPAGQSLDEAAAAAASSANVKDGAAAGGDAPKRVEDATPPEVPKYQKVVLKKGDGERKPKKGDTVIVFYTGTLPDGKVFDTNITGKKKPVGLRFKVGTGRVIKGWDEGLMTMYKGEKARLIIESEWAYGKKGTPDGKIPPNTDLTFEVELVSID
ncbi:peptidyl-prolyl cis-trans isomerase FKBP3 [Fimicolochytrium jonesii]|uniref:peptidyl-prolyl cis-trans isomerase FKBP3 n=1 Tax=Fimicolochytrium jonesii TaxID=1396493 RepID=UPI0022FF1D53|nr:peptidyl-prolyl cis-trans isomerase FKBP3 [Fimicolochytrium jonesii]KAI8819112.1 peptidyl-prolyl cis-trans isomerase FKBP3 [Fimicolochytrium jonesii]